VAGRVSGKDVTAFTREMGALLSAAIPIPQALDGLGEEEENPALRAIVLKIADSVRKGAALSAALAEHPKLFSNLVREHGAGGRGSRRPAQSDGRSGRFAGA
jgi:type II secretory pathway component PulF